MFPVWYSFKYTRAKNKSCSYCMCKLVYICMCESVQGYVSDCVARGVLCVYVCVSCVQFCNCVCSRTHITEDYELYPAIEITPLTAACAQSYSIYLLSDIIRTK